MSKNYLFELKDNSSLSIEINRKNVHFFTPRIINPATKRSFCLNNLPFLITGRWNVKVLHDQLSKSDTGILKERSLLFVA